MRRSPWVFAAICLLLVLCVRGAGGDRVAGSDDDRRRGDGGCDGDCRCGDGDGGGGAVGTVPAGLVTAVVTRVVDGDTIHVDIGGADYTVRYIGMDTPETVDPNRPVGCYGPEASAHNKSLVEGADGGA